MRASGGLNAQELGEAPRRPPGQAATFAMLPPLSIQAPFRPPRPSLWR